MRRLFIVMVGLPARGKSTLAHRLKEGFIAEGIATKLFNNGELRRKFLGPSSSHPEFYRPDNELGRKQREDLAVMNALHAKAFLDSGGEVAILDGTNVGRKRRDHLCELLTDAPVLFIECANDDDDLLATTVQCKARLPEFATLTQEEAVRCFMQRIEYYSSIYSPLSSEAHYMRVDTLRNQVLAEKNAAELPYYLHIRDVVVSDLVRGMYLARHGESVFNIEGRIGGDPSLTEHGLEQAHNLAEQFRGKHLAYVFTSSRKRSLETAAPVLAMHPECIHVRLPELDEINAGICNSMRYEDIREEMPEEYLARQRDKYHYVYPQGEGYSTMCERVERGLRKALFISGGKPGMLVIGHQAVNRMILSLFVFRNTKDVPYIYVPQNQYYYIEATHRRKLFELVRFMAPQGDTNDDSQFNT